MCALVILDLLLVQAASLVHASVHDFHAEDAYCDIMHAIERHDEAEPAAGEVYDPTAND